MNPYHSIRFFTGSVVLLFVEGPFLQPFSHFWLCPGWIAHDFHIAEAAAAHVIMRQLEDCSPDTQLLIGGRILDVELFHGSVASIAHGLDENGKCGWRGCGQKLLEN